jgi:superfamily II DNA or RNA helicase
MGYGQRSYQLDAKEACFQALEDGQESALVVMSTGTGKTVLSAMIIEEYHASTGRKSLFLAHRETLITQAHKKFTAYGLDSCVEMAGQNSQVTEALLGEGQVVVGSVASMQGDRLTRRNRNEFGLVIVDEVHHIDAKMHQNVIEHFNDKRLIGITATPKPELGSFFKGRTFTYPLTTAIHGDGGEDPGGWLVPPYIRKVPVTVDLKGIRTTGGDFNIGDLEERLYPKMNEIADAFHAEIGERQTVIFTPDCGSAQALADLLQRKHGRSCEYVAGTGGKFGMSRVEKNEKLDRFNKSEFQVLVNCELLFEGWDCPQVKCVGICRPTSIAMLYRYIQMVGRGLRPCPETGFNDCIVVDLDWQADAGAKDLTSVVDLYDDDTRSDEVMEVARKLCKQATLDDPDTKVEPLKVLEEAEEIVRIRTKLSIKVSPTTKKFKTMELNPVNASKFLDVKFTKKHDMDTRGNNPATDAQKALLDRFGVNPEGISKWGASKMLTQLRKRQDARLATVSQVKALMERGVDPTIARNLSAETARSSLAELAKAAAMTKPSQGSLF